MAGLVDYRTLVNARRVVLRRMRDIGRIVAFLVTLIVVAGALMGVAWYVARFPAGSGSISISLCALSSPDDLVIGAYLEANATELEQPAGTDDTPVTFVVESGETATQIANRLKQERLVSDAELFRRYVQYHGLDAGIVNVAHRYGSVEPAPELLELVDAFARMDGSAEETNRAMALMGEFCRANRKPVR